MPPSGNSAMTEKRDMWIGGQWLQAASGKTLTTVNPATSQTLAEFPAAGADDVDRAVNAARSCFHSSDWQSLDHRDRARILRQISSLIMDNAVELARLETLDNGKPIKESSLIDIPSAADTFEAFASMALELKGETLPITADTFSYTFHEPWGVVAQIIPWNYPLLMAAWKLAPALAAGNTLVLKPSELTPLSALELARIIAQTDLPAGAVNIVTGAGAEAGAPLVNHDGIDKIAFTGSTAVGATIAAAAARRIIPVSLELGGKSAAIVFSDTDIEKTVNALLSSIFMNQGQMCVACSRLLIQKDIYQDVLSLLKDKADRLVVADGINPTTDMGPLISPEHRDRVAAFVERALAAGAVLECGGPSEDPQHQSGCFYRPTILSHVGQDTEIWREEVFGPVLAVASFENDDQAVALANNSAYGLAASIWTRDTYRIQRLSRALDVGMLWVNTYGSFSNEVPFGGFRKSGIGKEFGREGLRAYCRQKSVTMDCSPAELPLVARWYGV